MKKQYMKPGLMVETIQMNAIMNNISTPTGTNVQGLDVEDNPTEEEGRVKKSNDDELLDEELIQEASGWKNGLW